ncbi:MAG TPA: polyribonucleotide nucleotidyltransferase, partial [Candidatus Paceibacterota bacterium]|nr:polyribonucleotide nucleotidyltransferase [Candidatus Paceibacterota bacterium]
MQSKIFQTEFGGKTLTAEFNDLAMFANGSVMLSYGETVILVTAVMGKNDNAGLPYFPLSVEFEEKFYAAGEILGSRFMRREGRPSDEAVLSARIVDRTIRPLFPSHLKIDVQIVVTVLAIGADDPDVLGVIGASLALGVSDIPWQGPVSAVRLLKRRGQSEIILNPTYLDRLQGEVDLELLACGKDGKINMIETAAAEQAEAEIEALLNKAIQEHKKLQAFQEAIIVELGKTKRNIPVPEIPSSLSDFFTTSFQEKLQATLFSGQAGKDHIYSLKNEFLSEVSALATTTPIDQKLAGNYFEEKVDEFLHLGAVKEKKRADGRGLDDLRALYAKAGGLSPVLHGSGIFYRGGTRIFSALTLGGPEAAQMIDTMEERDVKKRFMHHYNFPPFSVGETGRVGGFNRRMIGHGTLAE